MVDPLTLNSWPTALMPEGSSSNTLISSVRHSTAFQHLETLDITSSLRFGATLNDEITNRKHKKVKNMSLHRSRKAPFSEWEQSGNTKVMDYFDLSWEGTCQASFSLLCSCPGMNTQGLEINFREESNLQIWNLQMRTKCTFSCTDKN